MKPPSIIYQLEIRTRDVTGPWSEWKVLDSHTYFDRRTARLYRKKLSYRASSIFSQECECRIAVFDRRVTKPATFADVNAELKKVFP